MNTLIYFTDYTESCLSFNNTRFSKNMSIDRRDQKFRVISFWTFDIHVHSTLPRSCKIRIRILKITTSILIGNWWPIQILPERSLLPLIQVIAQIKLHRSNDLICTASIVIKHFQYNSVWYYWDLEWDLEFLFPDYEVFFSSLSNPFSLESFPQVIKFHISINSSHRIHLGKLFSFVESHVYLVIGCFDLRWH